MYIYISLLLLVHPARLAGPRLGNLIFLQPCPSRLPFAIFNRKRDAWKACPQLCLHIEPNTYITVIYIPVHICIVLFFYIHAKKTMRCHSVAAFWFCAGLGIWCRERGLYLGARCSCQMLREDKKTFRCKMTKQAKLIVAPSCCCRTLMSPCLMSLSNSVHNTEPY